MTTKPRHLMNDEEYAAYFLAGHIRRAAGRLEREAAEMRETADRIESTKVTSYTTDATTLVNSVMWTVANCNLGQLGDSARDADRARDEAKAAEKQAQTSAFGNLSRDDIGDILQALAGPAGYARVGFDQAAARALFERISGEVAAIDSLTADPEELEEQHGSMA